MTWLADSLWDLFKPGRRLRPGRDVTPPAISKPALDAVVPAPEAGSTKPKPSRNRLMQARYDALVIDMKNRYQVRVRKWRTSSSGCAWEVHYHNGGVTRLIEAPYPRGPMSCAIFLHEIGHHAIGFGRWRPRCLEEFKAWQWSLETMREHGMKVTPAVEKRVQDSMKYAVAKALRRGIRNLPAELVPFVPKELRAQPKSRRA